MQVAAEMLWDFFFFTLPSRSDACKQPLRVWVSVWREKRSYIHIHTEVTFELFFFWGGGLLTSKRTLPLTSLTRLVSFSSHRWMCTSFPSSILTIDWRGAETRVRHTSSERVRSFKSVVRLSVISLCASPLRRHLYRQLPHFSHLMASL